MRYLQKEERAKARELWETVFAEDSPDFLDAYDQLSAGNRISVEVEDGQVVSMIQWNPYELCFGRVQGEVNVVPSYYIVGVATREAWRHRGLMAGQLKEGLADLWKENVPFAFLMPAKEAIYEPFGFRTVYRQSTWKGQRPIEDPKDVAVSNQALAEAASRILEETADVYARRTVTYLERLTLEMECENGRMMPLVNDGALTGYIAYWPSNNPEVREIVCQFPEKVANMLDLEPSENAPKIMIRLVNLEEFVRPLWTTVQKEALFHIEDRILVENSGTYRLIVDNCGGKLEKLSVNNPQNADNILHISPEFLVDWMFGKQEWVGMEGVQRPGRIFLNETV